MGPRCTNVLQDEVATREARALNIKVGLSTVLIGGLGGNGFCFIFLHPSLLKKGKKVKNIAFDRKYIILYCYIR